MHSRQGLYKLSDIPGALEVVEAGLKQCSPRLVLDPDGPLSSAKGGLRLYIGVTMSD